MIGIIAVGTAVRDVFAKRTAQARAPPTVEIVLLRYILRGFQHPSRIKEADLDCCSLLLIAIHF